LNLYDPDIEESIIIELPAPTASGKTEINNIVMKILANECNEDMVLGTTPLIELLKQQRDNPLYFDIPCLLGKSNYVCALNPEVNANDCIMRGKKKGKTPSICRNCEYKIAKEKIDNSPIGWTTFNRYILDPSLKSRVTCFFVDESAKIEGILRDHNSFELLSGLDLKNLKESLTNWNIDLEDQYNQMVNQADILNEELENDPSLINDFIKINREIEKLERKMGKIKQSIYYVENDIKYIISNDKKIQYNKEKRCNEEIDIKNFKLLTAHIPFASMCSGLKMVVLSSATPSTNLLTTKDINRLECEHPIPIERRLCYFYPVGSMAYTSRNETAKKMAPVIQNLHEMYNSKTMLHAGSYPVAYLIYDELIKYMDKKDILLQVDKKNQNRYPEGILRNECSRIFKNSIRKMIWISVEMNEGVDLFGPDYKLNLIAKLPAEPWKAEYTEARNLYDKTNFGDNIWYNTQSANKLQQSYGRICRGPTDEGITYILDKSVMGFYNRYKNKLFYEWFRAAIKYV
ncbi:MAG: helicase C-terminal domain-containing protein, partial [Bacteroidales bacterium]